jgi:hypothetical protein
LPAAAEADILAREIEERLGRLQDRGLGLGVAGLGKRGQQGLRRAGRGRSLGSALAHRVTLSLVGH